jgi:hypothetical protein
MGVNELLSVAEIMSRFDSEWVLVEDVKTNDRLELQEGRVLWHSKDRDEVYRKAVELRPKCFATIYTGAIPEGTAVIL